ncbi:META domain-containing protein [Streptomyces sp. NPDC101118]|uniref:META domain-containing protein n=1 Tax=Streptomyces sp. NPDC101118 TaxID=3366109 RepID=UPI003828FE80
MRTHHVITAALAASLALTACGATETAGTAPGGKGVSGVKWTVETLDNDGKREAAPAGTGAHLLIEDGKVQGNNGCADFTAPAEADGNSLTVKDAEVTDIGCDPTAMKFGEAFQKLITGKLTTSVSGDRLTLTTAGGDKITLTSKPETLTPLNGTRWTVDSLVQGEAVTSVPQDANGKAWFVIGKDGAVQGNLGCNNFTSKATAAGGEVTFGPLASTRMACTGPAGEVEKAVSAVLKGKVAYSVESGALTLTAPNGKGLRATAQPAAS